MKHPLFNDTPGKYNGVPEEQVEAIRRRASFILSDAILACMTPQQIEEMKKREDWVEITLTPNV